MTNNLAFVGARGAGKSKITRKLSKLSGRALLCLDQLISYEEKGKSIDVIVNEIGWSGFRDLEYKVLKKVCEMKNIIIDCGGGVLVEAPAHEGAAEEFSKRKADLLKKHSEVVYIKRDWQWMMMKSGVNSSRPDLGGSYKVLLERRLPWYENASDFVLDMKDSRDILEPVELLMQKYPLSL